MWTEEIVATLRDLHAQGLSCGMIAKRFNVSRNAVIGKCHRLGLKGRVNKNFGDMAIKRKAIKARMKRAAASEAKPKPTLKVEVTPHIHTLIAIPTNDFMSQLRGYCMWPHGPVCPNRATRHSYCDQHHWQSRRAE
jgi:GcrA cell cycle regulator